MRETKMSAQGTQLRNARLSSNMAPQNVQHILQKRNSTFSEHNINVPCLVKTLKVSFSRDLFLNKVLPPQAPRRGIPVSDASTSSTSLLTGLSSLDLLLANTVTDRTWPWSSRWVATTLAMGHLFLGDWFSFNNTTSPTWKFLRGRIHLFLACSCCRYSLLHLDQNSWAICCVRRHNFLHYRSSFLNSPGGGSTSFAFPVRSILGDNGGAECGSLMVSTARGLLLIVYLASQRKVLNESSSGLRSIRLHVIRLLCCWLRSGPLMYHPRTDRTAYGSESSPYTISPGRRAFGQFNPMSRPTSISAI